MKKKIAIIVAALALAFTNPTQAQSTNAAPIVIAPVSATVLKPATGTLTAAQVQALETALANAGITFSGGYVQNINVRLTFRLQPGGSYLVTFYPTTPKS